VNKVEKATMRARPAAEYLGTSYWKLLELVKTGLVPHIRIGGRLLFRRETLDRWLSEQELAGIKQEPAALGKIRRLK